MSATIHPGYRPGCVGRMVELHAATYAALAGFGVAFEAKVAQELAAFCAGFRPGDDGLWLVVEDGRVEGSVAIEGPRADGDAAHLRWFILDSRLRGRGLGRQLLDAAMRFTDARPYPSTVLWTFEGLDAARHLYEVAGFRLMHASPGDRWGSVVVEQRLERTRPSPPAPLPTASTTPPT